MNYSYRMSRCVVLGTLLLGLNLAVHATAAPKSWRVIFLGDNGHHKPADRFKQLQPVLSKQGIEVVYTDKIEDVNSAKLAGFDCLAIYANTTRLSPEQEQAMLDFVQRGGGLVPIHCASYCFHNSPKYIELVGAQFQRHGTGVFKEAIINAEHPVMKGAEAPDKLPHYTTKGGDTFSGRLETETQTSLEILDTTGQKHVLQRKDIASLEASPLSIMPTGFEALPADDLKSLLEYLAQSHAQTQP